MPASPSSALLHLPRRLTRLALALLASTLLASSTPALAQPTVADTIVLDARDAWARHDRARLAAARAAANAAQHPLTPWVEYWELSERLPEAQQAEVDAFYARWRGTYVEDRLRNDWLLELGHRRDWANFMRDYPAFRMNDDREVVCYALLAQHLAGEDVTAAARAAWYAQRDVDEGCVLLATTMVEAHRFNADDLWRAIRQAVDSNRLRVARFAATLIDDSATKALNEVLDQPARYLTRRGRLSTRAQAELSAVALLRMASSDPGAAAEQLQQRWQQVLPPDLSALVWASVARQAAWKLMPEAVGYYQTAWQAAHRPRQAALAWSDDTLAWAVRASLRAGNGPARWAAVLQYIDAMSGGEQREPVWVYWKARALASLAPADDSGEPARQLSRQLLQGIAGPLGFYNLLAAEELDQSIVLPPKPEAPSAEERATANATPGLTRALQLAGLGLRDEGRREWNFTLRGMGDRELLAAAALACDLADWQLCINTSERTREEVNIAQRYPTPYLDEIAAQGRALDLDPTYVMGLIRQETRFMPTLRSGAGASGLMQVMPGTARWIARKIGMAYSPQMIADPEVNLRLGTSYLKKVLDDFGGSQALAAAGYNAGPNRSRRWRDGPVLEPAIWTENVPFNETRDYVKKVLANATMYALLMGRQPVSLKARLGPTIGPANAGSADPDLP